MLNCYAPPDVGGIKRYCDPSVRPSVRLSVCPSLGYSTLVAWRTCLGYRHADCLLCGLRTHPRTDVDPPRVELPYRRGISSRRPGAITCWCRLAPATDLITALHSLSGSSDLWRCASSCCYSSWRLRPVDCNGLGNSTAVPPNLTSL